MTFQTPFFLLLLSCALLSFAVHQFNCQIFGCQPQNADTHCYDLPNVGHCCFGDPLQPNVSADMVTIRSFNLTSNQFEQFSPDSSHIERCVFILVHDQVSSARAKWINDVARRINRVGQCLVQRNEYASMGASRGIDTLEGTIISYNTNLPHLMVPPTVLAIDWLQPSTCFYEQAASNARAVGRIVGTMLLTSPTFALWKPKVHCIGQGLGAHICGIAGSIYGDFKRITGLDPSRPLFEESDDGMTFHPSQRLDKSDATFVDVIHTTTRLGFHASIGHVDFFVNGLRNGTFIRLPQPHCNAESDVNRTQFCSHSRAHEIFRDSFMKRCYFGKCSDAPKNLQVRKCEIGWRSYKCPSHAVYCGAADVNMRNGEIACADTLGDRDDDYRTVTMSVADLPVNKRPIMRPTPRTTPPMETLIVRTLGRFSGDEDKLPEIVTHDNTTRQFWNSKGQSQYNFFTYRPPFNPGYHSRPEVDFEPSSTTREAFTFETYPETTPSTQEPSTQESITQSPVTQEPSTEEVTTQEPSSTTTTTEATTTEATTVTIITEEMTTIVTSSLSLTSSSSPSSTLGLMPDTMAAMIHPGPVTTSPVRKMSPALSERFERLPGNCRGIAIGNTPLDLSLEQCAAVCLKRPECAGFSYYVEHIAETAPCILKATGCPDPEAALFTFFKRLA